MNVSVNWLRALASRLDDPPGELARRLSLQAVAVDRVEELGEGLDDVVVARVISAGDHPDADRLKLCHVDAGGAEPLEVVCGAPNVVEGASYPFIPPGGTLPGGFEIAARKIRGIVSHGMLCSEQELGLGRDASGILRLADGLAPGTPLMQALDLPDTRFELDLTPNRVDLASHVGVARELAPAGVEDIELPGFGTSWTPEWADGERSASAAGVTVTIDDPARCFRYLAAIVRGVKVGPSPDWLRARLRAAGSRPINNVVDATNYVLLELGQPLHAFDLDRLEGPEIRVRAAAEGETLTTLDGTEHELDDTATVIADAVRPVALAGVMGGEDSEVTGDTVDVLLECAAFDPRAVRDTAAATELSTDASYRFERGIDEHGLEAALRRCVELLVAVAGGTASDAAIRAGRKPSPAPIVELRPTRVRKLLGLRLSAEQIVELLRPLGFEADVGAGADTTLEVRVPTWRGDVTREVDLIEEVARRYGYERFPEEDRSIRPSAVAADPTWSRRRQVRRLLEGHGLYETRGLPMVAAGRTRDDHVGLLHPLSATESVLRTDLVPPLLDRVAHNFARGRRDVRLYEIGTVFARDPGRRGPEGREAFLEELRVAVVLTGGRRPEHWSGPTPDVDLWDLRGLAEEICERLTGADLRPLARGGSGEPSVGAMDDPAGRRPGFGPAGWLGGDAFAMFEHEQLVGLAGRVRPDTVDAPPWAADVYAAEFRLDAVRLAEPPKYAERPSFPPVTRDLALLVPEGATAAGIEAAVREGATEELVAVRPFDVYEGEELEGARRSIAWRLVFRSPERTLTD
ncbi:MAG: phenylalanine--tRNA ligase subunit beta, partial [Gemmatimonadales bacterium]